jgi:hypothetical protein
VGLGQNILLTYPLQNAVNGYPCAKDQVQDRLRTLTREKCQKKSIDNNFSHIAWLRTTKEKIKYKAGKNGMVQPAADLGLCSFGDGYLCVARLSRVRLVARWQDERKSVRHPTLKSSDKSKWLVWHTPNVLLLRNEMNSRFTS